MSKLITGLVRFSFCNIFEAKATPSGDMKFSLSLMVPKSDAAGLKAIDVAVQEAIKEGIESGRIKKNMVPGLRLPMRDGDSEADMGKRGEEYRGFIFLNSSSKNAPGVVDENKLPAGEKDVYSGCWGLVDINFFAYNTAGNIGIGAGLNNVMKMKDDTRLDGRRSAESAFANVEVPEDDDDGSTKSFM